MTNPRTESVYFNPNTKEITLGYGPPALSQPWTCVSADASLGLLAIRQLLVEEGYVEHPEVVYWHLPQPVVETKMPVGCEVNESEARPAGPVAKLRSAFRRRGQGFAPM